MGALRVRAAEPAEGQNDLRRRAIRPLREAWPWTRAFWHRAYVENITGLAGMVAYNLLLALFPFSLLVLFIFGQVLQSGDIQASVIADLQRAFPDIETGTLESILDRVRTSSTTIGLVAGIAAVWIGASFWGAMDTAFCRIYHVTCRGWLEQKRFALLMLLVVVALLAASVIVPTLEGALVSSAADLPFGLSEIGGIANALLLAASLAVTFSLAALIYYVVPKGHVPWPGVWPGALFFTIVVGAGNVIFPFYLGNISGLGNIGGAVGFFVIAMIWFYLVSLGMLAGAVINALRYELRDTGTLEVPAWEKAGD